MSQEFQIEVRFKPEADEDLPTPAEIALVNAMLPELIKLMHELDDQEQAD